MNIFRTIMLTAWVSFGTIPLWGTNHLITYAGGPGDQAFYAVLPLSDGTVLVSGSASNLDWIDAKVPRTEWPAHEINSHFSESTAFILRLEPDLSRIREVYHFPHGTAVDIRSIRATNVPRQPTGDIYISGVRSNGQQDKPGGKSGYFIARLDANFVQGAPSRPRWVYNVKASRTFVTDQPWDVGSDGKVVFVEGTPFSHDWCALKRLTADGQPDVVDYWRSHHIGTYGETWLGYPARSRRGVSFSFLDLRIHSPSLRSWTEEDYRRITPDGNGTTRQGSWPADLFFSGPYNLLRPDLSGKPPGYTGYRPGRNSSSSVRSVHVDRRTNTMFFGISNQSYLPGPDRLPDFEPAVIAMRADGRLLWWHRLYQETPQNSPPDQYVDALTVDYSQPEDEADLIVVGRQHGNNVVAFWSSQQVKNPMSKRLGFQPKFTGTNSDLHLSWIGRLRIRDGVLRAATYLGEYADGAQLGKPSQDPLLDGWPEPSSGWPDLNTTTVRPTIHTDDRGNVYLIGRGRRTITTRNAFQKMLKPEQGSSTWNQFVRVYTPDLSRLLYSSILTGTWDPKTGEGGGNTELYGIHPVPGGLLLAGLHLKKGAKENIGLSLTGPVSDDGAAEDTDGWIVVEDEPTSQSSAAIRGNPIPTVNVPAWGRSQPDGQTAIFGRMVF